MDRKHLKDLLGVCFTAKRITETVPQIPKEMKPRQLHVLSAIREISYLNGYCRVSDVSAELHVTMPSISRMIGELECLGLVKKTADMVDRRIICLSLTPEGNACVKKYTIDFYDAWVSKMKTISNRQVEETIRVIEKLWETLPDAAQETEENS